MPMWREWVEREALPGRRVVEARELTGGYSNQNVRLTMDDGNAYVLRTIRGADTGPVEAALAHRLAGVVPVPEVIATGDRILLARFVPGRMLGEALAGDGDAAALGRAVGQTLARIGTVTFGAPGFFSGATLEPDGTEPAEGLDRWVDRCLAEGNADGHLTAAEQRALRDHAARNAPLLEAVHGSRQLVHSDFNPKNLLVVRNEVVAVLDWEFAFSGPPLTDVANMLRDPRPPGFAEAFLEAFRGEGGFLPPDWRELSRTIDLYAVADFLRRPPSHRYFRRSIARIRDLLA
ncbi:phosphotransferase family protein [Actinoplanes sp. NPDC020271]|uniref:phosphotransferase family protein n=1 Tax=Actinoplanes sp. NPDC020271 TaxID=3363896 RepID=UPI0037B7003A